MSADPLPRGAHLKRAIALYHQGRFDRMETEARAELARDPEDHEALAWLGVALSKLHREEDALAVLADAIRLRPDHADAHYIRARVLWRQAQSKRLLAVLLADLRPNADAGEAELRAAAEESLAEAIRLDPNSPEYVDFLADLRREQGNYAESLAVAERGLALDAQHFGCLFNRALALEKLDRLVEAREAFGTLLAHAPESANAHYEYGKFLLFRAEAPGRAVEHLREALRQEPDLEGDLRPLIAEALKRQSRVYDWIGKNFASAWFLVPLLAFLIALMWFGFTVDWRTFEVINNELPHGLPYVLLLLSFLSALNPLFNLGLCRTEFGRQMLSDTERRQGYAVVACLGLALVGVVWHLVSGAYTPILLALFALFWIDPVTHVFDLYPRVLQRSAVVCLSLSVLLVTGHLAWRWFGASLLSWQEGGGRYAMLLLGMGFLLIFVPFVLSRGASDFSLWRPRSRRRAVLTWWVVLLVLVTLSVGGWTALFFMPHPEEARIVRRVSMGAVLVMGILLAFEDALLARLNRWYGGKDTA